jgi:hypothetical protein
VLNQIPLLRKSYCHKTGRRLTLRTASLSIGVAIALFGFISARAQAPASKIDNPQIFPIHFKLTDVETGIAMEGVPVLAQRVQDEPPTNLQPLGTSNQSGRLDVKLETGRYAFQIEVANYHPWRIVFDVGPGRITLGPIALFPDSRPSEYLKVEGNVKEGFESVYGYTLDSSTSRPLAEVRLDFKPSGIVVTSDNKGFYSVDIPVKPTKDFDPSEVETVTAHRAGFGDHEIAFEVTGNDALPMGVPLTPGNEKITTPVEPHGYGTGDPGSDPDQPATGPTIPRELYDWESYQDIKSVQRRQRCRLRGCKWLA